MSSEQHTCAWVDERIDAYLDESLAGIERATFERHIDGCAACREELALATSVVAELRALPELKCPDRVVDRAAVMAGADEPDWRARVRAWVDSRTAVVFRPAMATMIFIIVAVGAFVLTQRDGVITTTADGSGGAASNEEIQAAGEQALMAFAYVGKYTQRSTTLFRRDVMRDRVMPKVQKAMMQSGNEVNSILIRQVLHPVTANESS